MDKEQGEYYITFSPQTREFLVMAKYNLMIENLVEELITANSGRKNLN